MGATWREVDGGYDDEGGLEVRGGPHPPVARGTHREPARVVGGLQNGKVRP